MVNVIIPTYKARDCLPKALDSLVSQTRELFIVTVVQDCDGEDYTDILDEYRRRGLQIKLIKNKENVGPGVSRQNGMDNDLMCDYFMFLDADDMMMPRAIELLYREAKMRNADMISSDFITEKKGEPGYHMDVDQTPVTWMHGKIYKAEYLRKNNIRFLPELRYNEDSYFNLVAANCTSNKYKIKECTYIWRDNPNSITRNKEDAGFFKKSWQQYVTSQVKGLLKIDEILGEIDSALAAATINNIYEHVMQAVYYRIPIDEVKDIAAPLKDNASFMKTLEDKKFWETVHSVTKATHYEENLIIFFKMRFIDWLNDYILQKEVYK